MGSCGPRVLKGCLQALVMTSLAFLCDCGQSQHCWCRCPAGNLVDFSEVSSSPPTCEELCAKNGCFFEGCSPDESQFCECSGGLMGTQTCGPDNEWGSCEDCADPPECLEGQRTTCSCNSGEAGWQHCESGSWGLCEGCLADCTPGLTRQCPCEGAQTGTQTCSPDGAWAECTDCSDPAVCEDGQEDICACENENTGVQSCESGQWGRCTLCESFRIIADIDYGNSDVVVGGTFQDVFDSTEWGCAAMEPGDDSIIWRLLINDGSNQETLWFEFDLPSPVDNFEVDLYDMSILGSAGGSQAEIYINGTDVSGDLEPNDGCVQYRDVTSWSELFIPGATNRIEVWSANNGSDQLHGFQGIWIWYFH